MKIYLMRHGETLQNKKSMVQGGGSDSPLTKKGIDMALKASKVIETLNIQRIYSGDLKRQIETTKLVNNTNIEHIIIPNLNEMHFGGFENTPIWLMYVKTYLNARYFGSVKDLSISYIIDCIAKADKTNKAENSSDVLIRVDKAMKEIITSCDKLDRILIISSGMYLESLIERYNPEVKFMRMKNCGIYCIDTENDYKVSTIYE